MFFKFLSKYQSKNGLTLINREVFMKRFLFLLPLLLLVIQTAQSQTSGDVSDTVWTKFTYPNSINAVKFTPDGKFLASGGDDGTPRLWDAETGDLVREYIGSDKGIGGLDINNTGELLAVVDGQSVITIWNLQTGVIVKSIDYYAGQEKKLPGQSIAFSHNGNYLAAILTKSHYPNSNYDVYIWTVNDWKIAASGKDLLGARNLAFSVNDKILAVSNISIADNKFKIGLFGVPDFSEKGSLEGTDQFCTINQSTFSFDGNYLADAINTPPNKVWNTSDWKINKEIGTDGYSIKFSPDSKFIILGENEWNNAHISIWDINSNIEIIKYKLDWLAKKYLNWDVGDNPLSIDVNKQMNKIGVAGSIGIYMLNAKWKPTSVTENPVQITEPLIFPNPSNKTANIRFNLIKSAKVNISIYDVNSNQITGLYDGNLESGLQNFEWKVTSVPSGTYFARITASGTTSSIKIIVSK
jgi:WD40 repeat protein